MTADIRLIADALARAPHVGKPQSKDGWQQLVRRRTETVDLVDADQRARMTPTERREYDQLRIRHHLSLESIETSQMAGAMDAFGQRLQTLAVESRVARPGMLISGPAGAGKSTALIEFGRRVELALRASTGIPLPAPGDSPARLPNGAEYLPVAYFSVQKEVKPTLENAVRFFNPDLPVRRRYSIGELLHMLEQHIERSACKVLLADQMQQIKNATAGALGVSDAFKDIMDSCPTTLIAGAGIGLERLRIFSDGYSAKDEDLAQTGSRFGLYPMKPYRIDSKEGRTEWLRLLATVERHLRLFEHEPRDLINMSDYLFERTNGLTGIVMPLLRTAANEAINTGQERITQALVATVYSSVFQDIRSGVIDVSGNERKPAGPRSRATASRKRRSHINGTPAPEAASA